MTLAAVDTTPLGAPITHYSAPREDFYKSLLIFLALFGGALTFVLLLTVMVALTDNVAAVMLVGAVFLGLIVVPTLRLSRFALRLFAVRKVYIFERGIIVTEGDVHTLVPWQDMAAVTIKGERLGVDYMPDSEAARASARLNLTLSIETHDGNTLIIESAVRQMGELVNAVGKRHALYRLERARRELQSQQRLDFGPICIEPTHMTAGQYVFRWPPLQRVRFSYVDAVEVQQAGAPRPRALMPISQIPNVHLLMLLLEPHAAIIDMDSQQVHLARWEKYLGPIPTAAEATT